jgi:hypothetical protein
VLERLGFDADGTLAAVRDGLRALARHQQPDGSFAPSEGRTRVYATALATLPFLGDGHASRRRTEHAESVARAVAWMREHRGDAATPTERGVLAVSLAEDLMLSRGRLTPAEVAARRAELASLAAALDGGTAPTADPASAVWPSLARRALAMADVVPANAAARPASLEPSWHVLATTDATDPASALFQGTAILLEGPTAKGFQRWSGTTGRDLLARLGADGMAKADGRSEGSRVEGTALVLLGLELVFRTY